MILIWFCCCSNSALPPLPGCDLLNQLMPIPRQSAAPTTINLQISTCNILNKQSQNWRSHLVDFNSNLQRQKRTKGKKNENTDHNGGAKLDCSWSQWLLGHNASLDQDLECIQLSAAALWFSPRQCDPDARWSKRTIAISMFARVRNWKPVTFTVHGLQLLCSTCSGTPSLPSFPLPYKPPPFSDPNSHNPHSHSSLRNTEKSCSFAPLSLFFLQILT